MGAPVVHWEINTGGDAKELKDFYAGLFDWHVEWNEQMSYGVVDTHSEGKGINGGIGPAREQPHVVFYIEVDDPQKYLDKAESMGAKTLVPVTEIPGVVTFAHFLDPQGNKVGLVKSEQQG